LEEHLAAYHMWGGEDQSFVEKKPRGEEGKTNLRRKEAALLAEIWRGERSEKRFEGARRIPCLCSKAGAE